jgi:hypothetical protein
MVAAFILFLHGIVAIAAFFVYRKEGTSGGWLSVAFVAIVFSVGWVIATMLTNLIFLPEFFVQWYYQPLESHFWMIVRKELNRDTISLLLLTLGEWGFYYLYFGGTRKDEPTPSTSTSTEK